MIVSGREEGQKGRNGSIVYLCAPSRPPSIKSTAMDKDKERDVGEIWPGDFNGPGTGIK